MNADDKTRVRPNARREATARNLQGIYTVVVGLALTKAIESAFEAPNQYEQITPVYYIPGMLAFLATAIPFYHGALRHLDERYIHERGLGMREGALLADFILLFVEGCILVTMAYFVGSPVMFVFATITLLGVDAVWGAGMFLLFRKGPRHWPELEWVWLNLATVLSLAGVLWGLLRLVDGSVRFHIAVCAIPTLMILRTTIDYMRSWRFYFP